MAAKKTQSTSNQGGMEVKQIKAFLTSLQTQLGNAIGVTFLRNTERDRGSRTLYYLSPPQAPQVNGKLPAIPFVEREDFLTWLVVEIEFERFENQGQLVHTSLKLYAGPTSEAAKLYFRAEWDARNNPKGHAQPHWNIHDVAWTKPLFDSSTEPDFDELVRKESPSFADFLNADTKEATVEPPVDALLTQMEKFHFAMSAQWFEKNSNHAFPLESEERLKNWVAGCASYIKTQITHLKI